MISGRIPIPKAFGIRGNVHHRAVVALPMLNLSMHRVNLIWNHFKILNRIHLQSDFKSVMISYNIRIGIVFVLQSFFAQFLLSRLW